MYLLSPAATPDHQSVPPPGHHSRCEALIMPDDSMHAGNSAGNLIPFSFEGAPVRVVEMGGDPWFVLADVCRVLEIGNPSDAARRLDDDERATVGRIDTVEGIDSCIDPRAQQVTLVNESGLYSLILTSRKPAAKRLKKWVTAEVLPAIRKTGGYGAVQQFQVPKTYAEALRIAADQAEQIEQQKAQIAEIAPKAVALDRISTAAGSLSITDAAKALQFERIKDLTSWLHQNKWIYRRNGVDNWLAHQDRIRSGWLEHKVTTVEDAKRGGDKVVEQVRVTPAGLAYLANKLGRDMMVPPRTTH